MIDDNAIFCSYCGARSGEGNPYGFGGYREGPFHYYSEPEVDNTGNPWLAVLCFLFWQVGLILWIFMRRTRPGKAKSAAIGSLAGVSVNTPLVGLVLWLIFKGENNRDFAKACGIGAIVGAAVYATVLMSVVAVWLIGLFV